MSTRPWSVLAALLCAQCRAIQEARRRRDAPVLVATLAGGADGGPSPPRPRLVGKISCKRNRNNNNNINKRQQQHAIPVKASETRLVPRGPVLHAGRKRRPPYMWQANQISRHPSPGP